MECIDENTIAIWFDGDLSAEERAAVQDHIDACNDCRVLFGELARAVDTDDVAPRSTAPRAPVTMGERIDRYVVLEWLGEGGMGVVYGAYDPQLDRRIAIKLLRTETDGAQDGERLLREAQSLAQVSHPNVIAVYDAGTHDGHIFIAMEHAKGGTLADWLRREKHSWRVILAHFLDAARGLAAVHAAGLVHRDFKPSNVLLGADGRVLVTDFGLAGVAVPDEDGHVNYALSERSWLGTLPYVSPEQLDRRVVDARSDQYSFCVTLYEALYGELPEKGAPPAGAPARIRNALLRGSSRNPSDRFPSMAALIAELSHDRRARSLRAGAFALALLAIGAGAFTYVRASREAAPAPCAGAERKLAGVWDGARKSAIRDAFTATGAKFASDAWRESERALDAYTSRWTRMHTQACEATRVHGEQSEELMDLRIACLDRDARQLKALTDLFTAPSPKIVERAVVAVSSLPQVEGCADVSTLRKLVPPPSDPAVRAEVARLRPQVDQSMALERAGDVMAAERVLNPILASVKATNERYLQADAHYVLGEYHQARGDWPDAETMYFESLVCSEKTGDEVAKARALAGIILAQAHQEKLDLALRAGRIADALLERMPEETGLRATVEGYMGFLHNRRNELPESLARNERALAIWEASAPDSFLVGLASGRVAGTFGAMGDGEKALMHQKRAIEILERTVGPHHTWTALALSNAGINQHMLRQLEDARLGLERARAIDVELVGPESRPVGRIEGILSDVLRDQGRLTESLRYAESARALGEKFFPEDRDMASILESLARTYIDMGRTADAIAVILRDKALCARIGNPPVQTSGANHVLGQAYLAAGQASKALQPLERALEIRLAEASYPSEQAETRFALARALWESGRDRTRARTLAEQARDTYASLPGYEPEHTAAQAWLAAHPIR